jgi:hypothetical protein
MHVLQVIVLYKSCKIPRPNTSHVTDRCRMDRHREPFLAVDRLHHLNRTTAFIRATYGDPDAPSNEPQLQSLQDDALRCLRVASSLAKDPRPR